MCGRFTLTVGAAEIHAAFPGVCFLDDNFQLKPRYNIAPTQLVAAILNCDPPCLRELRWGLIPYWAKRTEQRAPLINGRAETLEEKPSFRSAFRRRRCLIIADGFYEWQRLGSGRKQPVYVRFEYGEVFAFAGLWERWSPPGGGEMDALYSCSIVTTEPNEMIAPIHNRMPVILPRNSYEAWLAPGDVASPVLQPLLRPYPAEKMSVCAVAPIVNNPANDSPQCVRPL